MFRRVYRFRSGNPFRLRQLLFCREFSVCKSPMSGTSRSKRCRLPVLAMLSTAGLSAFTPAQLFAQSNLFTPSAVQTAEQTTVQISEQTTVQISEQASDQSSVQRAEQNSGSSSEFVIGNIVVRGNQQVETGTVLNNVPVRAGERFRIGRDSGRIIKRLYGTEFFDDVSLLRDGTTLIVDVDERPTIAEVEVIGNEALQSDQLNESLSDIGLATGRIYRRSVLDNIETELRQVYFSQGQYGTNIKSTVEELDRNRVGIRIDIEEGEVATISHMNIVGNKDFSEETLLKLLASGTKSINPLSKRDKYSRAKLAADTEVLRAWYFDRGYLRFDIKSTQVTISPDKQDINVTINIDEGKRYTVGDISFSGEKLGVSEAVLSSLVSLEKGQIYSRRSMTESSSAISDRLGEDGYAFADVNVVPDFDDENSTVGLDYSIDPGKRVYVRRIIFSGQERTQDEVLRREMRQLEGSAFSPAALSRSQTRLQRLPYIDRVSFNTPRVPGADDLVDIDVSVLEGASGSFGAGAGFGNDGFIFNINFTQENLFGTGERLTATFDNSTSRDNFSISYTDPYYTNDGISRNLRAFITNTDTGEFESQANFILDSWGGNVRFGVPLSEFSTFSFGVGFEQVEAIETEGSSTEVSDFIDEFGDDYDLWDLTLGYAHDTRNRTVFATRGARNSISLEATTPNSDLAYIKLGYNFEIFFPLSDPLTLAFTSQVNYGEGEDGLDTLPFFRRFFAGGIQSVRGYRQNTLGPRDSEENASGGDFRTTGSLELIFPPPFTEVSGATRLSLFADFGNVFSDVKDFEADELRGSYGVSFVWLAPIGPLTFSYANTFNDSSEDSTQNFQFTIGSLF